MKDHLNEYLLKLLPEAQDWVSDLEEVAVKQKVPIMDQLGIQFLMQLITMTKPKRVLEIGTGIGYSALRMLEANPSMSIVTIERDKQRYNQAVHYIKSLNKQKQIQVIYGDALEKMNDLTKNDLLFDFVFIDAAKGHYKQFFNLSIPLLTNSGLIISDNVLFKGYVAQSINKHPRFRKIVEKIREYNKWLMNHPDFTTSIIPIGDGVAVSVKGERGP